MLQKRLHSVENSVTQIKSDLAQVLEIVKKKEEP